MDSRYNLKFIEREKINYDRAIQNEISLLNTHLRIKTFEKEEEEKLNIEEKDAVEKLFWKPSDPTFAEIKNLTLIEERGEYKLELLSKKKEEDKLVNKFEE